jgi:tetratricopeptide (TPR) repeat protein
MTNYPDHEAADDALERIAHGAAAVPVWSVVTEADTLLQQRYPQSPFVAAARIRLAEGFVETNKLDPARQQLEKFLADSPNDARARLLLARVREAIGDRAGALEAYSRAARDSRGPELSTPALLGHARLLVQDQRWDQARNVAERLLKNADGPVTGEAAQIIAEAYAGEGDALAAAEYYLTAAYVTPTAAPGRAWLGAARAFVKLRQNEPAANAYRKCLAQPDVAADIADACRKGLAALPH